MKYDIYNT